MSWTVLSFESWYGESEFLYVFGPTALARLGGNAAAAGSGMVAAAIAAGMGAQANRSEPAVSARILLPDACADGSKRTLRLEE